MSEAEIPHAVNLAILKSFYDLNNATVTGRALFSPNATTKIQPIELPLFGEEINKIFAADQTAGYSLRKLMQSLQNESIILHTPIQAVVHDFLTSAGEQTRFTGWTNW